MEKDLALKRIEISRLNTDMGQLERKVRRRGLHVPHALFLNPDGQVDKEHRAALHYQQVAEEAKTPLQVAQTEIESLKKELLNAHRQELALNREVQLGSSCPH
jgi:hypothetical protein